jgi:hypothetical protein
VNARSERTNNCIKECERLGIEDYKLWPGVRVPSVVRSINLAHKQIVEWALENDLDEVCIAEDDFVGTCPNSWKYFLEKKPSSFDMYLSSVFLGEIDESGIVKVFTGMTLYVVSKKFYVKFLTTPDNEHVDISLAHLGDYHVCHPFTFIQRDGFSSNTGKNETYGSFFQNRELLV